MSTTEAVTQFSASYATARQHFREAATQLGWALESYSIDQKGSHGEELTIDVAITPGERADRALVVSSGLHGVEGFFGSAVQLGLLQSWAARGNAVPPVRCVFLHALNPYGFAWRRRVNESNVDLNRNLLTVGEAFSGSPAGYAALDDLLNPRCAPIRFEPVMLKFLLTIARQGMPALLQAVASGQYDFPKGLFYGGAAPSRTHAILAANLERWLGNSERVVHLDLHTGLGPWARYKLLLDTAVDKAEQQDLARWFGADSFECVDDPAAAYNTHGSFGGWCAAHRGGRHYLYATAEFGTYHVLRVLTGLRAENQAHHWAPPDDPRIERAKEQLVELFCPRSPDWRRQVIDRSNRLVQQAILGLLDVRVNKN